MRAPHWGRIRSLRPLRAACGLDHPRKLPARHGFAGILAVTLMAATSVTQAPAGLAAQRGTPAGVPGVAGTPMTAMVIGDSITQGSSGDFSWRYRLYKALTNAGVTVTFQGPYTDLFDNVASAWDNDHTYADPGFDQRHDARWGESLQTAAELIQGDAAAHPSDYLLVLLGVNDLGWGISDAAGTEVSLRAFIAHARAAKPDERFIFGQIPPNARELSDPAFAAMVADYNSRLVTDAAALSTPQSPIFVTDGGADINPATDLWDGIHPNAQGEQKIAAGFTDALAADFGVGTPYPRPYPAVPLGPQTHPGLSAQPGSRQALLTWATAPGATGYYVYVKNSTAGEASFTKLPIAIPGSSWTVGGLVDGDSYQIYLGTTKGGTQGVFSNTVSVRPASAPGAPTGVRATAGELSATVSWSPPASNGGAALTGYTVQVLSAATGAQVGALHPAGASATSLQVSGLSDGVSYRFRVLATNAAGSGAYSAASAAVSPLTQVRVTRLTDFNRDGVTDLIARTSSGSLYLYRGTATGGVSAAVRLGSGWQVMTALASPGDLTGDGVADLIARDRAGTLWLYPGNGASALATRRRVGAGWNSFSAIAPAAALIGTGRPGLLARDAAGSLWLYPLSGNAAFGANLKVGAGWNGYTFLSPGDLSGDGKADITGKDSSGRLWLWRGNGAGGVSARIQIGSGWQYMSSLAAPGNLDRTAGNDLVARDTGGVLWRYPGNNASGFAARHVLGTGWNVMSFIG